MLKLQFNFKHLLILLAIVSFFVTSPLVFTSNSYATNGVPRIINFQGRLVTNPGGVNVANGNVSIVFSLYNGASGGTPLWTETQSTVAVTDGIFRVALGSSTPIPANFNFNWDGLYLGVNVAGNGEMTPRIQMASVPFAFNAGQVAGLSVMESASSGSNASTSATLKLGSATTPVAFDLGQYGLTLQTSGTTSLKLPTSGTVLTYLDSATSGTLSSITSAGGQSGSEVGLGITLATANTNIQYGIQFNLSGTGTGGNQSYDLYGTGGLWKISNTGVLNVASCVGCGGGGTNYWNLVSGANGGYISPINSTADLLIGSQATTSAAFAVIGLASSLHQTIASVSGNFFVMSNNGFGGSVGVGTNNPVPGAANALEVTGKIKTDTQLWAAGSSTGDLPAALYENFDNSATDVNGISFQVKLTNPTTSTTIMGVDWHKENGWSTTSSTNNADLILNTFSNATALEVGRFLANGNFGLQTAAPTALLDVNGAASVGGQLTFRSSFGTIQTTADQQLTLGGNTTGKILLSAFNGQTVTVGTTGAIVFGGYNSCTLKTDGSGNLRCDTDLTSAGTASPFAEITGANGGYIRAGNLTEDFLLGGSSTTSAKFAILNLNSGIPTATISGNMIVMPYTSGGNELGGFLGIGTTNPLATLTDIGTALFQTPIASSAAFQIQNSAGAPVFLVDTTNTTNLLTNPGFETGITGWSTRGTSTISKNTNKKNIYAGQASLLMGTSTANSGASTNGFTAILGAGTYTLSFNAMLGSGTLTTLNVGYNQGASDVPCTLNSNAVKTTGFQRYTCTFTTSGNLSYIYIDDGTGASLISLFIDAVQLEQNGFASPYTIGAIQLRGLINSPVAIQPLSDSTSVFQIQNSNGNNNLFVADSLDNAIGIGTNAPLATLDVRALNGINPVASISGSTSFASLVIDQAGAGDLLTASDSGATRFVLRQNGSVSLGSGSLANAGYTLDVLGSARIGSSNTPGDDILKQTTSDFTVASGGSGGATAYSVTTNDSAQTVSTANNQLSLVTDLLSAAGVSIPTPAGQGPATGQAIGGGAVAAQRPDSTFIVISGNGSNTTRIYDPVQNAFLTGPTLTTTANTGTQIFQRQNGKFVIIPAGGTTGVSNIYDPAGSVNIGTIRAGPPLAGAYQIGAGSQVIRRSDGKFMIIMGNNTAGTMIYDPTATTSAAPNADIGNFNVGPNVSGNVQAGSFAFETIYGKWVIGLGTSQSTSIYDPSTGLFTAGPTWTSVYAVNSGAGAHVIQRPDYKYEIILGGGSANTIVYDPTTNAFSAGPSLQGAGVASTGAHSFQRSNGTWATVLGGSSANNTVEFYDPTGNSGAGTYSASTGTLYTGYNTGAGALTFQRPDGKYVVLTGGTATTSTIYDAGWNTTGTWISEGVASSKISTYSALLWTGDPQSANNNARLDKSTTDVFVRTAISGGTLANSTWVNVNNSGDLIQAVSGAAMAQIQVTFNAPVRSYPQLVTSEINQSNIWPGEGSTFNRRSFLQPSIYSLRISDPMVQYGGGVLGGEQYGRNFATAGAVLEGVVTTNTNQLTLNVNRNLPTASPAAGVIIASASANLGASAAAGSFTLQLPTGKFLVIIGGSTTTRLYDPDSNTFSTGPTLPTGNAAIGAHGFQLPDGRFFVVQGGNNTSIYDPVANVFSKGPNIMTGAGTGALSGANSMQLPDGRYLIILANQKDTNIYDPFLNQMTQGPYLTAAATAGGMHVIRPDGRVLIFLGGSVNTNIYDAATNAFLAGPSAVGTVALGSTVAQLANGRIIYTIGGAKTIYYLDINGTTETTATAVTVTATVAANWGAGAAWIPRPDGKLLLIGGGANASIYIYDPVINTLNGSAVATALLPCAVGAGGHVFQRPDGTYMLICGGATPTVTVVLDAGWNLGGTYFSEQINAPALSSNTSIFWQNVGQGNIYVKYRTAPTQYQLGVTPWRDAAYSGNTLSVGATDQWIQTRFDLQGSLPDLPGALARVWNSAEGGSPVAYYRTVATPTLGDWTLMNSSTPTVLTLTANGSNAFRFSADGQAYTSVGGAWNSGGADLAENYTSTQTLNPGEVVVGDKLNPANVEDSTVPYQTNIMGVVSTKPGFVAGAYTPNSYPIALVGRVPVKVSTENGPIHSGDYLTSASIPGYAMKATVAGRVLGTALEDFDPTDPNQTVDCPADGAGSLSTTQCGTITAFINLTSYNGESVELAMADQGFTASPSALTIVDPQTGLDSYMNQVSAGDRTILSYLESLSNGNSAAFESSEVFTGKVVAGEIISPNIIADLITAKTIKADHIEGLDILTNRISALEANAAVLSDATGSAELATASANLPPALTLDSLNVGGLATISGDLNVSGNSFIQGALNVLSNITTKNLLVSDFAYFINDVVFKGNVRFENTPTFNNDTAGFAVIKKGLDTVQINFNQEYINTPIVTASIALDRVGDDIAQKQLEDSILNGNISYVITQRTTKGFVIRLNKPASEDITLSWVALSVKDAKTSGLNLIVTPVPMSTQSAAFQSILNQLNVTPPSTP